MASPKIGRKLDKAIACPESQSPEIAAIGSLSQPGPSITAISVYTAATRVKKE
jgi:hypothetical protein